MLALEGNAQDGARVLVPGVARLLPPLPLAVADSGLPEMHHSLPNLWHHTAETEPLLAQLLHLGRTAPRRRLLKEWTLDLFPKRRARPAVPTEIEYLVFRMPTGTAPPVAPEDPLPLDMMPEPVFAACLGDALLLHANGGRAPERISAGSSGSYFVYSSGGEVVGVFKPKDEEPYGPLLPKWTKWLHRTFFPCFFGRACLIPNLGYIAELAASVVDRRLGLGLVPFTSTVEMASASFFYDFWDRRREPRPDKIGSFQQFVHGYVGADVFFRQHPLPGMGRQRGWTSVPPPVFEWSEPVLEQFRFELEKLVVLDYLIRNTDRGADNWMLKVVWAGDTPQVRLAAIDNGLAFPWKHPDGWRIFPPNWLYLPALVIGQPFLARLRSHVLLRLTLRLWWEETSVALREVFARDSEFTERMWRKQWAVLKGQAFNVVQTLACEGHGPLELVRRLRVLVLDDYVDVPVLVPVHGMQSAIDTPSLAGSAMDDRDDGEDESTRLESPLVYRGVDAATEELATKRVIVERLVQVTSRPPTFTWC